MKENADQLADMSMGIWVGSAGSWPYKSREVVWQRRYSSSQLIAAGMHRHDSMSELSNDVDSKKSLDFALRSLL